MKKISNKILLLVAAIIISIMAVSCSVYHDPYPTNYYYYKYPTTYYHYVRPLPPPPKVHHTPPPPKHPHNHGGGVNRGRR